MAEDVNETIREELAKIAAHAGDGKLLPSAVIEAARDESHPLHRHFTWDDSEAAHQHRLWQARVLIARVVVADPEKYGGRAVPVYVSLISDREEGGYRAVEDVIESEDLRAELIATAKSELASWVKRHQRLTELVGPVAKAAGIKIENRKQKRVMVH